MPKPASRLTPTAVRAEALFRARRYRGVVAAYLFGSHARGTPHRESDVDVGLVLSRAVLPTRADRSRVADVVATDLIGATHRNEVDVVALNDAPPELSAAVVSRGRRLYCADEPADRDFVRNALFRRADILPFLRRTRRLKRQALTR